MNATKLSAFVDELEKIAGTSVRVLDEAAKNLAGKGRTGALLYAQNRAVAKDEGNRIRDLIHFARKQKKHLVSRRARSLGQDLKSRGREVSSRIAFARKAKRTSSVMLEGSGLWDM